MHFPKMATIISLVTHALLEYATLPARGEICLAVYDSLVINTMQKWQCIACESLSKRAKQNNATFSLFTLTLKPGMTMMKPPCCTEARPYVGALANSSDVFKFSQPRCQTWWWRSLQIIKWLFRLFQPPAVDLNLQVFLTATPVIIELRKPFPVVPFWNSQFTESMCIIKKGVLCHWVLE